MSVRIRRVVVAGVVAVAAAGSGTRVDRSLTGPAAMAAALGGVKQVLAGK
jgi:hypothetical protein